jgi:hypothetical protein
MNERIEMNICTSSGRNQLMLVSQFYSVDKQKTDRERERDNTLLLSTKEEKERERENKRILPHAFSFVITESTTSMSLEGERMMFGRATLS